MTLKPLVQSASIIAVFLSLSTSSIAGGFTLFQPIADLDVRDIASEVTDEFIKKFPVRQWKIFLYSTAGTTANGTAYCYAIAGVTKKDDDRVPRKVYEAVIISPPEKSSMTEGRKYALQTQCAKNAIENMMSVRNLEVYLPQNALTTATPTGALVTGTPPGRGVKP